MAQSSISKEKIRAQKRVADFSRQDVKDWDRFTDHTARKSFVRQLGNDPLTDEKLLRYADSMNRLKMGAPVAQVTGDGGRTYSIKKLRGKDRLGCTCNDWRYVRSVAESPDAYDCKHIKQYQQMSKTAGSFRDTLPRPTIDGKPHDGTWTIVGSGRLSIPKKTSDIDYMVPLEEVGDLSSFQEYKDVPGVYWRDSETIDGRPSTIVALPRYAYDKIDASYQQATERFGRRKLRQLKKTLPKDSFYKDIGVVYTSDAMKKEAAELCTAFFLRVAGHGADKVARAPRDYKKEYAEYHSKPEQVENRSLRNQARRKLGLKKGDPREADHKTPLSHGGGNSRANLRAVSRTTNREKFNKVAEDRGSPETPALVGGAARHRTGLAGLSLGAGLVGSSDRALRPRQES